MKNDKLLLVILTVLLIATLFVACDPYVRYRIQTNDDLDYTITVGEEIDFTEYFTIETALGESIPVTVDMLDLSAVNLDEVGSFDVKCSYGGATCVATFTVVSGSDQPTSFAEIAELYNSYDKWNFVIEYEEINNDEVVYKEIYKYQGLNRARNRMYVDEDTQKTGFWTDYLQYDAKKDYYWYYEDNGDGTHTKIGEDDTAFENCDDYMIILDLKTLGNFEFNEIGSNAYQAVDPVAVGNGVLGVLEEGYYSSVTISVANGKISKVECVCNDGYLFSFEFSEYGSVNLDFSKLNVGGGQGGGVEQPAAFTELAKLYNSYDKWNFVVKYEEVETNEVVYSETYEYLGYDFANTYIGYDENDQPMGTFTDYLQYDVANDCYWYYEDQGDGTYTKYGENDENFQYGVAYMVMLELTTLNNFAFTEVDANTYVAVDPVAVGNEIMGELSQGTYASVTISVESGKISKIECACSDGYIFRFIFSGYGTVDFDLSKLNIGGSQGGGDQPVAFSEIALQYNSYDKWNFVVEFTQSYQGEFSSETYEYMGTDIANTYMGYDQNDQPLGTFTDYLQYDVANNCYWYYEDQGDGTYTKYGENDEAFQTGVAYMAVLELTTLNNIAFNEVDANTFVAVDPITAGNSIVGEYDGASYTSVTINVASGKISKIECVFDDGYIYTFEFSGYGTVDFDLSKLNLGGSQGGGSETTSLTTTFTDKDMGVGSGELEYTATVAPYGFDAIHGLQFTQNNGATTLTSKTSVENVTSVTVSVYCNNTASMKVNVSVGNTDLLCDGIKIVTPTAKQETNLVFVASSAVSGQVKITLTPNASKNSMYISTIAINDSGIGGGGSQGGGDTPSNVMEEQVYNPATFDKRDLQDRMVESDGAIGLPSTGTFNALVIPVQFVGTSITQAQLSDLNSAFNGTSADTGWESVSSYYKKSSYGNLNITFDIQSVYNTQYNASYYSSYQLNNVNYGGQLGTRTGEEVILMEVLAYYENILDLTKYDSNKDGCIDAVYLIYSAPVDYAKADFFWAYVTWDYNDITYDGLDAYYYLFAGFDFMYEDAGANANMKEYAYAGGLDGLKINASTYIHETGHLLGLDDYYDYEEGKGSDEGLGGSDMMDATVGDQGAYSKIMLGWVEPTVVTTTQTITIKSLQASGNCIIIPLNFNNSYFSEYLLIDLYSAEGLNALHASPNESYLYGGASYGARIYHVSSEITTPYKNDYQSFTANNNTSSDIALIKLVEADGESRFSGSQGYATQNDLWHTGDVLSDVFAQYKRNDGKVVNFDISFDLVSKDSLTITITFTSQAQA